MARLNDFEIQQYVDALEMRSDSLKALYQELKAGILSLTDMQERIDMTKKQVLELHKKTYNYWQSGYGIWHCYLPKSGLNHQKEEKLKVSIRKSWITRY